MARLKPDWSTPRQDQPSGKFAALDHIREQQQVAWAAALLGTGALVLGWNLISTTRNASGFPLVQTYQEPTTGYQIRITMSYVGDFRDRTTYEADVGSGWELFDPPTTDAVYDGFQLLRTISWTT